MELIEYNPDMVLQSINDANGTNFAVNHVDLVVKTDSDLAALATAGLGNTEVYVNATEFSPYTGSVLCTYNRMNVSMIHTMLGGKLAIPTFATSIHDALTFIETKYGVVLPKSEIVDAPISITDDTITLTAVPESLTWMGSITFDVVDVALLLSMLIPVWEMADYQPFREPHHRKFAETFFYGRDMTHLYGVLSTITKENYDPAAMAIILSTEGPIPWSIVENVNDPNTLLGSMVRYNGPTENAPIGDTNYDNVLVISIWRQSLVMEGDLVLHYNNVD